MKQAKIGEHTLVKYAYRKKFKSKDANGNKINRPHDIPPVGVVIAKAIDGEVRFGWSKCSKLDQFNRGKALEIALGRLEKNRHEDIAVTMRPVLLELADRAKRYFKQDVTLKPFVEPEPKDVESKA